MKRRLQYYFPQNIRFFFLSLILLLVISQGFRIALFFLNAELAANASRSDILYSLFNIGFRFDLYISLIILLLPFVLVSVPFLANKKINLFLRLGNWLLILLAVASFSVSSSDLGFFRYYNSRITKTVFDWTGEFGIMLKVMADDSNYLKYTIIFLIVSVVYVFLQLRISKRLRSISAKPHKLIYRLCIFIGMLVLIFFGIRGSFNFNKHPLNIDDAFFSENLFINQLGLNPVYSLGHSYGDVDIEYFESKDDYIQTALQYLEREKSGSANPFQTEVIGADTLRPNVVLIFLESMSNAMVSRYNPSLTTTPFLDSLAKKSIVFDNFYSAGVHTHNGITATFYGLPAVMNNKPMKELATANMHFHGLPWILQEKGYQTSFYVTGSKEFDNMNDFLLINGFNKVIGESDYQTDSLYNAWGVKDKTMFNRILNDCDSLYKQDKKFFVSALTISAHEGYAVPKSYQNKIANKEYPNNIYELSDLILKEFITAATEKEWFSNTVFVIVGDHGQNFSAQYDLNLNYHQVPLLIYAPDHVQPAVYLHPGLQQDIYPTLLSYFDFNYVNNGLGLDLFKHEREYAYFSADDKLGVIDDRNFLIYRGENNISLFSTEKGSKEDVYNENKPKAEEMMRYGFSMVQSAKFIIDNKLTNIREDDKYDVNRYIAHAGGRIGDHDYTNSLEALDLSYQKGFRLFELDILTTSDGFYVAAHDWKSWQQMTGYEGELPPGRSDFKKHRLLNKYSPMDMQDINNWFLQHEDAILVTDKINTPFSFSSKFIDPQRLMMELFTIESLEEASKLNIKSAMPTWDVVTKIKGDKIKYLKSLGVTDIAASRNMIKNNISFLRQLINQDLKVYIFHINYEDGKDESWVFCNEMDYIYGMYADDFDFSNQIICD